MKKNVVTVADAAELLDVSVDTIRRWEKKGLIKSKRSDHNYRLFNLQEIKRILKRNDPSSGKSKYRILRARNRTNYSVIDLFSGAGGTALGFENAGLNHVFLNEINKDAISSLRLNKPRWKVNGGDISEISFKGMKADIVEGGFPCQAFSYAGNKLGFEDARGTLFFQFVRCIKEVRPKIAVGENVRGLLRHDNGRTLKSMVSILNDIGYKVVYRVLRSQYLDVPQKRERLIMFALRRDLDPIFVFPKEKDYIVTLGEALKNCPGSPSQKYPVGKKKILSLVPPGGYWKDLPKKLQKKYMGASFYMGGGKTGMARRLSWDEPSLTLTCSPAQKQTERCHPEETRPLSVREYARIQTFPDSWEFVGSTASQYKQIGNAVPVNLGYHIAKAVIAMLDGIYDSKLVDIVDSRGRVN
ncbi:MAG: DNA (cytosine-5-)-methyltransferase [Candidatus Margulisiibacteriota bacterium]|nr:DNA (cytosine-5-)-methyltransferase [Candidatus Margulisiibacteriota bacterium]